MPSPGVQGQSHNVPAPVGRHHNDVKLSCGERGSAAGVEQAQVVVVVADKDQPGPLLEVLAGVAQLNGYGAGLTGKPLYHGDGTEKLIRRPALLLPQIDKF